jgi:hypothetical protein
MRLEVARLRGARCESRKTLAAGEVRGRERRRLRWRSLCTRVYVVGLRGKLYSCSFRRTFLSVLDFYLILPPRAPSLWSVSLVPLSPSLSSSRSLSY